MWVYCTPSGSMLARRPTAVTRVQWASARQPRHPPCVRHLSRAREEAPEHKPAQLQPVVEIYGTDCLGFMPCDFAGNAQGWAFLSGRIAGTNAANEAMAL